MPRRQGLERRLFGWFLALALAPAMIVLGLATWLGAGSLGWLGTLGPWQDLAESGRSLFQAAEEAGVADSALAAALASHREELSGSLGMASRWAFLGQRVAEVLPVLSLIFALLLVGVAFLGSRRLARQLGRPISELVDWAGRLARDEDLPPKRPAERREVVEVHLLREAFRSAASELVQARRRALAAERVRVWGEMARRVAHEMKNPLTPLRLATYRLEREGLVAEPVREALAVVRQETARLEEMAQRFAVLGRPPEGPRSEVDLGEMLQTLLGSDVPPDVEADVVVDSGVPTLEAHHGTLVGVFRNLLRNAVEAMDRGGSGRRLEVRIAAVPPPDASTEAAASSAPWVEVRIVDTGPGLPPGFEQRIFEPDFTTRAEGTGLGLAVARQGVAQHGGVIRAVTREEGGAEFAVALPACMASKSSIGGQTAAESEEARK